MMSLYALPICDLEKLDAQPCDRDALRESQADSGALHGSCAGRFMALWRATPVTADHSMVRKRRADEHRDDGQREGGQPRTVTGSKRRADGHRDDGQREGGQPRTVTGSKRRRTYQWPDGDYQFECKRCNSHEDLGLSLLATGCSTPKMYLREQKPECRHCWRTFSSVFQVLPEF